MDKEANDASNEAAAASSDIEVGSAVQKAELVKEDSHDAHEDRKDPGPIWLAICFFGIMGSLIIYGMVLEYATSGGRKLHELSFIFVTSSIYSITAYICRIVQGEAPTTVPTHKLLVLAMTSMGSTFTSVRSLRYVIFPVQVLAKSCKPIPVMIMGAMMGKKYPMKKYVNVAIITLGVAMFMGLGDSSSSSGADADKTGPMMWVGVGLLFVSLCFDGGTGAYEDKLMHKDHIGPFELMYNIQLGKAILAFIGLMALNEVNYFFQMCYETGPILFLLGVTGAMSQIFIFVTISKFGALTCALIGLARKITTLIISIIFYGHKLNHLQTLGLAIAIAAMIYNFAERRGGKKKPAEATEEIKKEHLEISDQKAGDQKEKKSLLQEEGEDENDDAFPDAQPEADPAAKPSPSKGSKKKKSKSKK